MNILAQRLVIFFYPPIALLIGIFITIGAGMFFRQSAFIFDPAVFWSGYGLFLISLVFHELGHASACTRYGAIPGAMGFAIYWIYPVFYSDVTAAWQLKRWQRVVVDASGVFFQLIIGASYALVYTISNWTPLHVACIMIGVSCLFTLNPILKFDGYWIIADALGVTNLAQQKQRILQNLIARIRKQLPEPLPWPTPIISLLLIYTTLSVGFWCYFIWALNNRLWFILRQYPSVIMALIEAIVTHSASLPEIVQSFALSTFMLLITLLMAHRLAKIVLIPFYTTSVHDIAQHWQRRG